MQPLVSLQCTNFLQQLLYSNYLNNLHLLCVCDYYVRMDQPTLGSWCKVIWVIIVESWIVLHWCSRGCTFNILASKENRSVGSPMCNLLSHYNVQTSYSNFWLILQGPTLSCRMPTNHIQRGCKYHKLLYGNYLDHLHLLCTCDYCVWMDQPTFDSWFKVIGV